MSELPTRSPMLPVVLIEVPDVAELPNPSKTGSPLLACATLPAMTTTVARTMAHTDATPVSFRKDLRRRITISSFYWWTHPAHDVDMRQHGRNGEEARNATTIRDR